MKYFTQSNLRPGNCWQTAIACVIEVLPEELPPQHIIEAWPHEVLGGWGSYQNVLNAYLRKHWHLMYDEHPHWRAKPLELRKRHPHVLCGPTVRTAQYKAEGVTGHIEHCVAEHGTTIWDPHPSRAGLLDNDTARVGILLDSRTFEEMDRTDEWRQRMQQEEQYRMVMDCLCAKCNWGWALERAAKTKQEEIAL